METIKLFNEIFFCLFAGAFIAWEVVVIVNMDKIQRFDYAIMQKFKTKAKYTDIEKSYFWFNFAYYSFIITGLFSAQWIYFLAILSLTFIPKKNHYVRIFDAIASLCLLGYIVFIRTYLYFNS